MTANARYAIVRSNQRAEKPWLNGFCTPGNPLDSHKRCVDHPRRDGKPCACTREGCPCAPAVAHEPEPAPAPGSDEWLRKVTASKVAAILGVSPYESQRSIWHKMRGEVPSKAPNEVQSRGHFLEPAILAWWRDRHSEVIDFRQQPLYLHEDWASATPDAEAVTPDETVVVEAKSAAYDDDWGDPGTDAIPTYYLVQCYFQLALSGAARCYVPMIGPRLKFAEYVVQSDPAIEDDLLARMRAFYDTLTGEPPDLDDSLATYDVIRKLHPEIDRGEVATLTPTEAREYIEAANAAKAIASRERLAKSVVLDRMGRAQYAECDGTRIARRQPGKGGAVSLYQTCITLPTEESA